MIKDLRKNVFEHEELLFLLKKLERLLGVTSQFLFF